MKMREMCARAKASVLHLLGGSDGRLSWGKVLTIAVLAANQTGHPLSDTLGVAILGYAFGRSYLASKEPGDA